MSKLHTPIEKSAIAASFSKAAHSYDKAAILQNEIGSRLIDRLQLFRLKPQRILDIGCGTGYLTQKLSGLYPKATIYGVDIAEGMINYAKHYHPLPSQNCYLCCDAEHLPFPDNSFDFIFSNCSLQWLSDLPQIFSHLQRLLNPGGLLLFTTLGPNTLQELRNSFAQLDDYTHVNDFEDMHNLGDALLSANFHDPVMDMEMLTLQYDTVQRLMADLKQTGAHNLNSNRPKHLMSKQYLQKLVHAYEQYRAVDNYLPASFEVLYGHAFGPETQPQYTDETGQTFISIDDIKILTDS